MRIRGRVQGVWFRGWTREQARNLNLDGWVRNRRDGSVEAVFKGDASIVDQMARLCQQGPPHAKVDNVEIQETPDQLLDPGFYAMPTA